MNKSVESRNNYLNNYNLGFDTSFRHQRMSPNQLSTSYMEDLEHKKAMV